MKKRPASTRHQASHPNDLFPVETIASQLLEDIQHIYGAKVVAPTPASPCSGTMRQEVIADGPMPGELVVIATRNKQLRTELLPYLSSRIAVPQNRPVAIFSAGNTYIQLARELVNLHTGLPADAAIYDGKLNVAEINKLTLALGALQSSKIHVYPMRMFRLDDVCIAARKFHQQYSAGGLLLVDAVQFLADRESRRADVQHNLLKLKALANETGLAIVALYQLDPNVQDHPSTLARNELGEVERLNELADGFVLMSVARGKFVFEPPKILNAKSIEWLGTV